MIYVIVLIFNYLLLLIYYLLFIIYFCLQVDCRRFGYQEPSCHGQARFCARVRTTFFRVSLELCALARTHLRQADCRAHGLGIGFGAGRTVGTATGTSGPTARAPSTRPMPSHVRRLLSVSAPLDPVGFVELNRCRLRGAHTQSTKGTTAPSCTSTRATSSAVASTTSPRRSSTPRTAFSSVRLPYFAHYYTVDRNCAVDFWVLTDALLWLSPGVGHTEVSIQPSEPLYAVVSLAGPQEKVWANFGQAPFLWDFQYHQVLHARPPRSSFYVERRQNPHVQRR
jgi:hypothetical protein